MRPSAIVCSSARGASAASVSLIRRALSSYMIIATRRPLLVADHAQRLEAAEVGAEGEHAFAAAERLDDRLDAAGLEAEQVEALLQQVDAIEHRRREGVEMAVDVAPGRGAAERAREVARRVLARRAVEDVARRRSDAAAGAPRAGRRAIAIQRMTRSRAAGCCARAGAPSAVGGAVPPSTFMARRRDDVGARDLAAGDVAARRRRRASRASARRGEVDRQRRARADRREELDDRQARLAPMQARQRRLAQRRLEHLGEQGDAGQHRLAGEVAVERRMVDGDLDRCARRRPSRSSPTAPRAGAPRARRAAPASACRSPRAAARRRGRCGAAGTPRRRGRAAPRRCARARRPARRRRRPGGRRRPRRRRSRAASRTRRRRRRRSS